MLLYEAAVFTAIVIGALVFQRLRKRHSIAIAAQVQVVQVLAVFVLLGILAVIATISVIALKSSSAVKACEQNELAIATALTAYDEAVGSPIANQAATVLTAAKITTIFANPSDATVIYLSSPIIDPVNPAGSYTLTYTSGAGGSSASYTIVCPGVHSKADLNALGGTWTAGKIQYSNGSFTQI
jgi:type II secretory pathway pseudopilin PulG